MHRKRLPKIAVLAAATPALAFGHLIGRIGCFLVGDDYGRPSDMPWAVAFPQGLPPTTVPVHPTQLYEAVELAVLGWMLLRWRRQGLDDKVVLGRNLVAAGALRFGIEFIRINTRIVWGLTVAHVVSLAVITAGVGMLTVARAQRRLPHVSRTAS
jgi:phosphatidylglycerol---prolipoprotein diacylglyceryl transferase